MIALGIDIGGTKIAGGIVDDNGSLLDVEYRATDASKGKDYVLEGIDELITKLRSRCKPDAIGIGSAGRIDVDSGSVYYATSNLPNWTGLNLKRHIEDRHGIPTIVDNDVNTAGIGEMWLGAGKDEQSTVCVTLGTGIAAAVFVDGKIVRGGRWSAGEIGHMILYPGGRPCNCGQRGCFEQYGSGTALYRSYNERRGEEAIASGRQFFELLAAGDIAARDTLDAFISDLAVAFISLANVYDPDLFIVGGGLIDTKEWWWERLERHIREQANPAVASMKLVPAAFKNQAGMLGAAKLGFEYVAELNASK